MARALTIHAGPPKTATSSVQDQLWAAADELAAAGVLYPQPHGQSEGHVGPSLDLLGATWPEGMGRRLSQFPPTGSWSALVAATHAHPGEVIWSSEQLSMLPDAGFEQVAAVVRDIPTRVVLVERRYSSLLASWYQQQAKTIPVGSFEDFARTAVAARLASSWTPDVWLDTARVAQKWRSVGCAVTVLDARAGLSDEVVDEVFTEVTGLPPRARTPHANTGQTAASLDAMQSFMAGRRMIYAGACARTINFLRDASPVASDPLQGGMYRVRGSVAEVLDQVPWDAAAAASARELLAGAAPITERVPGAREDSPQWREAVARAGRLFGREQWRFRAADTVQRARGRRRPHQRRPPA